MSGAIITALMQGPAFLTSCTQANTDPFIRKGRQIYIQWAKNPTPQTLDLFFFDTLGSRNLDAYQQVNGWDGLTPVYGLAGTGAKRLVILSGHSGETPLWAQIRSYGDLCKHSFTLMKDAPEEPLLYGEALLEDGASKEVNLSLRSPMSAIQVRSLACDFGDRPYASSQFSCARIYLQYAGIECRPLDSEGLPTAWINPGQLDSAAVARLPHPDMILQGGCGTVGPGRVYLNQTFYCYANPVREATLGQPVTRLVLEGSIDGKPCYYPIELPGLQADELLEMDITLLRMGSPDPDLPVHSETVRTETRTVPWDSYEPYSVSF